MKALNNLVSAAGLLAVVEALRIGERFGLDPNRMVDVLNASTGRNNTTESKARQFMLSGTYASGFAMRLMVKDMTSALRIAEIEGVPAAESETCLENWRDALAALGSNADHTEIHRWLPQREKA
jgi:3-hydroxyisobutyrate dehydrogenase